MKLFTLAVLLVSAASVSSAPQTAPPASEVAAALQKRYDAVRDFSADFTHQHEGGVLRRKLVEQGTLFVRKPGQMRWEYKSPERKVFVSDGIRSYFYDPGNNQVTVSEVPADNGAATAALFLTGRGSLVRDFAVSFANGGTPDTYVLRLDPKQDQPEYDWLELTVDRKTLQIQALTAADKQGGRQTFLLSNLRENIGLADKVFVFQIPRGADVVHAGRAKR